MAACRIIQNTIPSTMAAQKEQVAVLPNARTNSRSRYFLADKSEYEEISGPEPKRCRWRFRRRKGASRERSRRAPGLEAIIRSKRTGARRPCPVVAKRPAGSVF